MGSMENLTQRKLSQDVMRWNRRSLVKKGIFLLERKGWVYSINPRFQEYFEKLSKISEESERLLQQLDEALAKQVSDQTITIMARLFSLQIKERHVKAAQEWPVDMSFLSKLMVLGLIPIISRIMTILIIS